MLDINSVKEKILTTSNRFNTVPNAKVFSELLEDISTNIEELQNSIRSPNKSGLDTYNIFFRDYKNVYGKIVAEVDKTDASLFAQSYSNENTLFRKVLIPTNRLLIPLGDKEVIVNNTNEQSVTGIQQGDKEVFDSLVNSVLEGVPKADLNKINGVLKNNQEGNAVKITAEDDQGNPVKVNKITTQSGEVLFNANKLDIQSYEKDFVATLDRAVNKEDLQIEFESTRKIFVSDMRLLDIDFPSEVNIQKQSFEFDKPLKRISIESIKTNLEFDQFMDSTHFFEFEGFSKTIEDDSNFVLHLSFGEDDPASKIYYLFENEEVVRDIKGFVYSAVIKYTAPSKILPFILKNSQSEKIQKYYKPTEQDLLNGFELGERVLLGTPRLVEKVYLPIQLEQKELLVSAVSSKYIDVPTSLPINLYEKIIIVKEDGTLVPFVFKNKKIYIEDISNLLSTSLYWYLDFTGFLYLEEDVLKIDKSVLPYSTFRYSFKDRTSEEKKQLLFDYESIDDEVVKILFGENKEISSLSLVQNQTITILTENTKSSHYSSLENNEFLVQGAYIFVRSSSLSSQDSFLCSFFNVEEKTLTSASNVIEDFSSKKNIISSYTKTAKSIGVLIPGYELVSKIPYSNIDSLYLNRSSFSMNKSYFSLPFYPVAGNVLQSVDFLEPYYISNNELVVEGDVESIEISYHKGKDLSQKQYYFNHKSGALLCGSTPNNIYQIDLQGRLDFTLEVPRLEQIYFDKTKYSLLNPRTKIDTTNLYVVYEELSDIEYKEGLVVSILPKSIDLKIEVKENA